MPDIKTGHIEAPDVTLYYKIRGSGPVLVILQGGAGNADGSEDLANYLAGRFTVVTYDRRGLSRSAPFTPEGHEVAAHSADVASLIAAFTAEPVLVFGASIGALIGLDLATRHPNRIRALVAHEPPAFRLLDTEALADALRRHSEVLQAFERHGVAAGMKLMVAMTGLDMNDREPDVPVQALAPDPQAAARRLKDLQHFLTWDVPAVLRYQPDIGVLKAEASRILPAVGGSSSGTLPHRCATALAAVCGTSAIEFPGGHSGYVFRPKAFAAKLTEVFGAIA